MLPPVKYAPLAGHRNTIAGGRGVAVGALEAAGAAADALGDGAGVDGANGFTCDPGTHETVTGVADPPLERSANWYVPLSGQVNVGELGEIVSVTVPFWKVPVCVPVCAKVEEASAPVTFGGLLADVVAGVALEPPGLEHAGRSTIAEISAARIMMLSSVENRIRILGGIGNPSGRIDAVRIHGPGMCRFRG